MIRPYLSGLQTGMLLQLAIGPLFLVILSITLSSSFTSSISAIFGVTLVDFFYIALALAGIGALLQRPGIKNALTLSSALVLLLFGGIFIYQGITSTPESAIMTSHRWTPLSSFTTTVVMTISSPLTIIFFTSIFSLKGSEYGYSRKELVWFGFGTGSATLLFLSSSMLCISLIKQTIPSFLLTSMNCIAGFIIAAYGIRQLYNQLFKREL